MSAAVGTEVDLYEQLARYLNLTHPELVYHFDLSGMWTPSHKARNLYGRLNRRAWPDLFIAKSMVVHRPGEEFKHYHGLFLELKREGARVYLKDGTISKDAHIFEQWVVLQQLRQLGYKAEFAVGFAQAVEMIELYLEGRYE